MAQVVDERLIPREETFVAKNARMSKMNSWDPLVVAGLIATEVRDRLLFPNENVFATHAGIDGYWPGDTAWVVLKTDIGFWRNIFDSGVEQVAIVQVDNTQNRSGFRTLIYLRKIKDKDSVQEVVDIITGVMRKVEADGLLSNEIRIVV